MKKRPPESDLPMPSAEDILTWLNGRLIGALVVIHDNNFHVLWTQDEAVDEGLTIEDAVLRFARKHRVDVRSEANP